MSQSPYLLSLERAVASAVDDATAAAHKAEIAAFQARMGEFEKAESLIAEIRSQFGDGRNGRVSIGVMCAEAQLIYFKDLGDKARDRMARAQLLSIAGRDSGLTALTSAWLAHICFNQHRYAEMSRAVKVCLETIGPSDNQAACRIALTLGDAFYAAEDRLSGSRWYAKAHTFASRLGDHSAIAALTYNRAGLDVFVGRIRTLDGPIPPDELALIDGEVRSARNYQAVAGLRSFTQQLENATVGIRMLQARYQEALAVIESLLSGSANISPSDRSTVLQCDHCLALTKVGQHAPGRSHLFRLAASSDLEGCTPDDQIVAISSLVQAAEELSESELRESLKKRLESAVDAYQGLLRDLKAALNEAVSPTAIERL